MHDRFPKFCVWWFFAPPVYPTCFCCQCVAPLILIFNPMLIDLCGLVQSSDVSHMTVQCHWLQQSFPNGGGAQFPIFPLDFWLQFYLKVVSDHRFYFCLLFFPAWLLCVGFLDHRMYCKFINVIEYIGCFSELTLVFDPVHERYKLFWLYPRD